MPRAFPRPQHARAPTGGGADELLADPIGGRPPSTLDGYQSGRRVRIGVYATATFGLIGAILAGNWYIDHLRAERSHVVPSYAASATTEGRGSATELHWGEGPARLGLSRDRAGVHAIVLPDRVLRLAETCNHAQVKIDVVDGRTVSLKVLTGEIVQEPRATEVSPTATPATAP